MKVVRYEDVPITRNPNRAREGELAGRKLLLGEPGTLGNFMLTLSTLQSDYRTPRHRHNFDQIRYIMTGESDFARDGKLKAGSIGYFPEGTYYGPNQCGDNCFTLRLAFGGASGDGFISAQERQAALLELRKHGEFKEGIYTITRPDGRKKNQDGYEAVWEYVTQRKLKYSKPCFEKPVFSQVASFEWVPSETERGVARKIVGIYGERGVEIGFFKLDAGATTHALRGNSLYFVTAGAGTAAGEPWSQYSTIHLKDQRETGSITATEPSEILHIGMPDLSRVNKAPPKVVALAS